MEMINGKNSKWSITWLLGVFIMFLGVFSGGCENKPPSSSTDTSGASMEANMNSSMAPTQMPVDTGRPDTADTSMNTQGVSENITAPAMPSETLTPPAPSPSNMEVTNPEADNQGMGGSETTNSQSTLENSTTP